MTSISATVTKIVLRWALSKGIGVIPIQKHFGSFMMHEVGFYNENHGTVSGASTRTQGHFIPNLEAGNVILDDETIRSD